MAYDNLTILKDTELIAGLKQRLTDERAVQAECLAYLGEADRRRLYAGLGYSSFFIYCVDALG